MDEFKEVDNLNEQRKIYEETGNAPEEEIQKTEIKETPQDTTNYYSERYKTKKKVRPSLWQLIIVSVMSAIFGAAALFAAFVFIAPSLTPAMSNFLSNTLTSGAIPSATTLGDTEYYKKIEITQSDSPVTAIAEKVSPSIIGVKITLKSESQNFFFDVGGGTSEGSGIIIREDGYILTNNHVIEGALTANTNTLKAGATIEIILPDLKHTTYVAKVVGRDSDSDLAVLKVEASGLPAAELGDSDTLKAGELAVAIGNPGGLDYMGSITAGVISGLDRKITTQTGNQIEFIQTDAAINPGNSGGALCNSAGQVIGVNTIKISATDYEGLGFAIPINYAKDIANSLIEFNYVKGKPQIGISIDQRFTKDIADRYNVPFGLLVGDVTPMSAAYNAGIKSGDIVTKFDGVTITSFSELETQKNKHKAGDTVTIEYYREGVTTTVNLVLDEEKY